MMTIRLPDFLSFDANQDTPAPAGLTSNQFERIHVMKKLLLTTVSTCLLAAPAFAESPFAAGDFMIRARALDVIPHENSNTSVGGTVDINNNVTPELDFSYFFTPNISAELIAAVTKHDVKHSSGADAGSAWLLPPTLTLQYHFTPWPETVIPYVGAGINYTHFFDEKGGALGAVSYDDSFGGALQAGADIPLDGNWYANIDVKKVFISTTAKFSSGVRANVDIDPLIVGLGVGYKF
jgi:outer membrane protein